MKQVVAKLHQIAPFDKGLSQHLDSNDGLESCYKLFGHKNKASPIVSVHHLPVRSGPWSKIMLRYDLTGCCKQHLMSGHKSWFHTKTSDIFIHLTTSRLPSFYSQSDVAICDSAYSLLIWYCGIQSRRRVLRVLPCSKGKHMTEPSSWSRCNTDLSTS